MPILCYELVENCSGFHLRRQHFAWSLCMLKITSKQSKESKTNFPVRLLLIDVYIDIAVQAWNETPPFLFIKNDVNCFFQRKLILNFFSWIYKLVSIHRSKRLYKTVCNMTYSNQYWLTRNVRQSKTIVIYNRQFKPT